MFSVILPINYSVNQGEICANTFYYSGQRINGDNYSRIPYRLRFFFNLFYFIFIILFYFIIFFYFFIYLFIFFFFAITKYYMFRLNESKNDSKLGKIFLQWLQQRIIFSILSILIMVRYRTQ